MEFEIIKGQKGKEHMGFNKEGYNEDSLMGENLQILNSFKY